MPDLPDWLNTDVSTPTASVPVVEPPSVQEAPKSTLPDWMNDESTPLKTSIQEGVKTPPEQAAKILKLQNQTGLPSDLITRNTDAVDHLATAKDIDPGKLHAEAPLTSSWLSETPLHAAIAVSDMARLHSIERLSADMGIGAYKGSLELERSALGLKGLFGFEDSEDSKRIEDIERKVSGSPNFGSPPIFGKVAEQLPIMAGATLAGLAVSVAPEALGAAAIARGALFGASSAGSAYLDYKKIRDENNNPIDPTLAKGAALTTGVLNAILQEKVFANIAEKVPAFQSLMPDSLKTMLQSQTLRAAVGNYLLKIGEQAGAQGGVSWINSMAQAAGGDLSKMVSDGSIHQMSPGAILSTIFSDKNIEQAGQATKEGMAVGAAMSGAHSAYDYFSNYKNIIRATDSAKSYEDMGNHVQQMKMLEHSPEKTQEAIKRIVGGPDGDGPNKYSYVPMDDFNKHFQDKGIDPRQAATLITGSPDIYDEASRTGTDLQIPTEKYLTTIGADPEANKFFSQVVRTEPENINAKEADISKEILKADKEAASEEKIKDAMVAGENQKEGSSQPGQELPPTEQALQGQKGISPLNEELRRSVFPGSSDKSITGHPEYIKMRDESFDIVNRYAKSEGIEPTPEYAKSLWGNLHDELGRILKGSTPEERLKIAKEIKEKNPTIENDFATLKDQLWSDTAPEYFEKFVKGGKYKEQDLPIVKPDEEALNAKGRPYALFIGNQQGAGAMYNVYGEHPTLSYGRFAHSTASEETLKKEGIPIIGREARVPEGVIPEKSRPIEVQAINAVEKRQGMEPLFSNPRAMGMTEADAARYAKAVEEAHASAQEELARQILDRKLKEKSSAWNKERDSIKEVVSQQISQQKEYVAIDFLRGNAGESGLEPFKLKRSDVEENDPTNSTKGYPVGIMADNGAPIDQAAELLGFNSGSEMLYKLKTVPTKELAIDNEVDRQMLELHPDPSSGPNIIQEAMKVAHNEKRSKLLMLELKHLASDNMATFKGLIQRISRPIPKIQDIRNQAERIISTKTTSQIIPSLYLQAEAQASREAGIHFSKGDLDSAFQSKQRELLNHELYRAAVDAKETISKGIDYVKRLGKESVRDRIAKASGGDIDYIGRMDDILDRFDFRKNVSLKDLDRRESLRQFIADRQAEGYSPIIPDKVLDEAYRKGYKELPLNEFNDVIESLKSIENLAKLKGELLANQAERSFTAAREEIIESIKANNKINIKPIKPRATNETNFAKEFLASQTRLEFLFGQMDGHKPSGATYQYFFKPTVDAQNTERDIMQQKMYKMENGLSLNDIFSSYSKAERAQWYNKKIYIPEIDSSLLKPNIIMAALNLGNEYNRNALKEGYGWSDKQLKAITDHLDERDWQTVQKIWDHLETYKADIGKLEKRLNGQEPEWVKHDAFDVTTKDGKKIPLRGGYFPILFDPKLSYRQTQLNEKSDVADIFGGQWAQAMTRQGHTIARTNTGGKPLLLQFSALTNHISNVVHDLAWRETVIDLNHLINDPEIRGMIKGSIGDEKYKLLNPWLRNIAGEKSGDPLNPYESLLGTLKGMATTTKLGLSVTSGLKHLTNYGMALNELGMKYGTKGFIDSFANPMKTSKTWKYVTENSKMMAAFDETYDRDVRDMFKGMNITGSREGLSVLPEGVKGKLSVVDAYTHDLRKTFFLHYGYMYRAVALPAWIGAYQKAMDGKIDNVHLGDHESSVDYADHVVRTTIASASTKDLPNIMNQRGLMKLFTMYYGPMNLVFNNIQRETQQFSKKSIPSLIAASMFIWFGPAAIQSVITGRGPSSDDDADTWVKYLLKSSAMYGAESIIGLRDAARAVESGGRDFSLSPVEDVGAGIIKATIAASSRVSGEKDELTDTDIKNILNTAGYFTGLPTTQAIKTVEYIYDWLTGAQSPDNPMEGVFRALVGAKKVS